MKNAQTPPSSATSRLSTASCRSNAPRVAPIAVRIANSRRLPHPRDKNKLLTFAQAISSTNPTEQSNSVELLLYLQNVGMRFQTREHVEVAILPRRKLLWCWYKSRPDLRIGCEVSVRQ